jgi:NAD-dependent SIR2 family protein deacetylase
VHFADVEIPDELLRAQRDGNLVVFAGAGVSIPSPSDLPTFEDLVRELAVSSGAELHPNELPEIYLGRLARTTQYPVDREVANIIGRSTSKPSALHSEIIHLFPEASDVRIVTTNFDAQLLSIDGRKGSLNSRRQHFLLATHSPGSSTCMGRSVTHVPVSW